MEGMIEGSAYLGLRDALDGAGIEYTIKPEYPGGVRTPIDIGRYGLSGIYLHVRSIPEKPVIEPEHPDVAAAAKEIRQRLTGKFFSNINGLPSEPHPKYDAPGISSEVFRVLKTAGIIPDFRGLGHHEPSPLGAIAVNKLGNGSVEMGMGDSLDASWKTYLIRGNIFVGISPAGRTEVLPWDGSFKMLQSPQRAEMTDEDNAAMSAPGTPPPDNFIVGKVAERPILQ